jgi:hypothetical protein
LRDHLIANLHEPADPRFADFLRLIDETPALRDYSHRMFMRHETAVARAIAAEIGAPQDDIRCAALAHFALEARALIYQRHDRRQAAEEIFALLERGWAAVGPGSEG